MSGAGHRKQLGGALNQGQDGDLEVMHYIHAVQDRSAELRRRIGTTWIDFYGPSFIAASEIRRAFASVWAHAMVDTAKIIRP